MDLPERVYLSETDYIDFKRKKVITEECEYDLTGQQNCLLEHMVDNEGVVFPQSNLVDYLVDHDFGTSTVTNLIKDLRKYGELKNCITTRYGIGYVFETSELAKNKTEEFNNPKKVDDEFKELPDVDISQNGHEAEDSNPENKSIKKFKIKKILSVFIPVVLVITILSGAIFGINIPSFKAGQDVYHITVNKPEAFNDDDREILEQRVKIFADGEKYSIDFNEDKIEMYLPVSSFNDNEIEYVLDAYITRATKLYAINSKEQNSKEAIFIDRDDIESVNVLNGPIEGVDASEYGIGISDYKYFSIILKDEFIAENSEALEKFGESFTFAQDLDNDGWYYYYTFPQDDKKTFYVLNNDLNNNFINLLEFNLTHNCLSVDLNDYVVDINSKTSWQNVSDINNAGVNQCNFDKLSEGTVTFSLSAYGNLSEGESLDTEKALKQRLDVLGNPYALGTYSTENETFYIIKTTTDNMSLPVMNLIGNTYSYILKGGLSEYWLGADSATLTKSSNGNKLSFIQNYYDDYEKEELMEFIKSLSESEQIYMYIDNMPLLSTDINNIDINTGTISFSNICQMQDGKIINESIDDEYSYLLDMFNTISETSDNMESLSFEAYQFNVNKHGNLPTENDFNLKYDFFDDEIVNKVKLVCPSANVAMNNLELYVSLNLPVDDNIVSSSLEYSEAIYNAVDFQNSTLEGISIYFIDEDNTVMERGRIFFDKNYKTSYSEGYISTHGIFTNGRLEKYKDEFKEAVGSNKFISDFNQDEYAWVYSMN